MLKKTSLLTLVLVVLCCAFAAYAQGQRPRSTPEQRKQAVEIATFLETTPLAKEAKDYRSALFVFLTEVPDITVKICTSVFGESKRFKGDYESELMMQMGFSQAKFIIENAEKAQDEGAVYLAGVEGVLRTWQAIKTAKPKAKFALMDELLEKQKAGTLAEHVQAGMEGCNKKK